MVAEAGAKHVHGGSLIVIMMLSGPSGIKSKATFRLTSTESSPAGMVTEVGIAS